ncbi:MAG: efflux RND transporter periplasmic adaptor subunit [Elainellaceae cyanobacterium]
MRDKRLIGTLASLLLLSGCAWLTSDTTAQEQQERGEQTVAVDGAIARTAALTPPTEYTGTTLPSRSFSLRSQAEGKVLSIAVDVGDGVTEGDVVARVDDALLEAGVVEAEAEVAAREADVASLRAQVDAAQTRAEEVRLELQQAQSDAARLESLGGDGAVSDQVVEQARTLANTTEQALQSAVTQVQTQRQAVDAALGRVAAQQALVSQAQQRRAYATVVAPSSGVVLSRALEPGDFAQPGSEILTIGDLQDISVEVQVSELDLAGLSEGQSAQVRLDAFPDQVLTGSVTQISPVADPTARLIPVEVTIANVDGRIGSGLLARVSFDRPGQQRVVVPEAAVQAGMGTDGGPNGDATGGPAGDRGGEGAEASQATTIFIINSADALAQKDSAGRNAGQNAAETKGSRDSELNSDAAGATEALATVTARSVQLGDRADNRVEILSGLEPGDFYVARSTGTLADGDQVRLSIISETPAGSTQETP